MVAQIGRKSFTPEQLVLADPAKRRNAVRQIIQSNLGDAGFLRDLANNLRAFEKTASGNTQDIRGHIETLNDLAAGGERKTKAVAQIVRPMFGIEQPEHWMVAFEICFNSGEPGPLANAFCSKQGRVIVEQLTARNFPRNAKQIEFLVQALDEANKRVERKYSVKSLRRRLYHGIGKIAVERGDYAVAAWHYEKVGNFKEAARYYVLAGSISRALKVVPKMSEKSLESLISEMKSQGYDREAKRFKNAVETHLGKQIK